MSSLMVWVIGFSLLIVSIAQYMRIRQLEARLRQLSSYEDRLAYLREQLPNKDNIAAIKALRAQYLELSLIEALQLWEQK